MRKNVIKKVTLESLAGMVARGFDEQEKKLTQEIGGVKSEIKGAETRLTDKINTVETRLSQQITGINFK